MSTGSFAVDMSAAVTWRNDEGVGHTTLEPSPACPRSRTGLLLCCFAGSLTAGEAVTASDAPTRAWEVVLSSCTCLWCTRGECDTSAAAGLQSCVATGANPKSGCWHGIGTGTRDRRLEQHQACTGHQEQAWSRRADIVDVALRRKGGESRIAGFLSNHFQSDLGERNQPDRGDTRYIYNESRPLNVRGGTLSRLALHTAQTQAAFAAAEMRAPQAGSKWSWDSSNGW